MTIKKLFNNPHVLYQTSDDEFGIAEPAISVCVDAGGLIILNQEDQEILVNRASAKELCKLLHTLKQLAESGNS